MLRGFASREQRFMRRVARDAATPPLAAIPVARGAGTTVRAGAIDPETGEFVTYGRTGLTTLGEGFRVTGLHSHHYGRVGRTTLGEGFKVTG